MPNINENAVTSASQKQRILDWMLEGNAITPMEALTKFGSFRLGARIADIKDMGYDVKSRYITVSGDKRVKQYYL